MDSVLSENDSVVVRCNFHVVNGCLPANNNETAAKREMYGSTITVCNSCDTCTSATWDILAQ